MKKILIVICLFFLCITFCSAQNKINKPIDCEEFYEKIQDLDNAHLFDLRDENEFNISHIIDANLADTKDKLLFYLKDIDKDSPIFIYCEKGIRSKQCGEWLKGLDYNQVYELKGGFELWLKDNYPVDTTKVNIL